MPEKKVLITFNARNENDQQLFCKDLAEAIAEVCAIAIVSAFSQIVLTQLDPGTL